MADTLSWFASATPPESRQIHLPASMVVTQRFAQHVQASTEHDSDPLADENWLIARPSVASFAFGGRRPKRPAVRSFSFQPRESVLPALGVAAPSAANGTAPIGNKPAARSTRLALPSDIVRLSDRLLYVLQPSLETL
ncbi:MAG: hypothetical protein K8T25_08625, partial [Planctomycetia bacterium]|nr:hypothetical protein [Planctomycetia bacterium]